MTPNVGANEIFHFPLGMSLLKLQGQFKYCSAGNNWKCQKPNDYQSQIKKRSMPIMARIIPRITGQRNYENRLFWWYITMRTFFDFSVQDTWLDMIVQEIKNPNQHIFEKLFGTINVNADNLVVMNKLYPVEHAERGQWNLDLLLYSFFSKFEKKDLIIRVRAKSTVYDKGKPYTVTNQIWSDVIKLSVNNPGYPVSLRGSVLAELTNIAENVSTDLKAYWTADATSKRYTKYCMEYTNKQTDAIFGLSNFMHFHKRNNDYAYHFTVSQFRFAYTPSNKILKVFLNAPPKTKRLGSWNEANSICKSRGSYLPVFRSKEEQDELMRYLKLVKCTPSVNILYIGLTVNLVRYFYYLKSRTLITE